MLARGRPVALEDPRVTAGKPCPSLEAAGKNAQSVETIREPMSFERRARRKEAVLLRERKSIQQVPSINRDVAFAEALEKDLCTRRILIQQSRCSGEQQDISVAWMRAHRLLSELQKPGMTGRIGKNIEENPIPSNGRVVAILVPHLRRLIAKRANRLRERRTRHDKSPALGLRPERTTQKSESQPTVNRPAFKSPGGGGVRRLVERWKKSGEARLPTIHRPWRDRVEGHPGDAPCERCQRQMQLTVGFSYLPNRPASAKWPRANKLRASVRCT